MLQATFHSLLPRWQLNKLYHLITDNSYQSVPWVTLLFCVLSAVLPSNKLFFVVATLYFLALVYITRSIYKALFFAFIPFGMLNIGQIYITTVIPFNQLKGTTYYEGRQLYFRFSPFFVLGITSAVLLMLEIIRRKGQHIFTIPHLFVLGSVLFSLVSVFHTEQQPLFSLATVLGTVGSICWILLAQLLLKDSRFLEQTKILKTFLLVLILMTSLQTGVALTQYVKRSTLNLRIEQSTIIPTFGQGADEDATQFRPIGLQTHANDLANDLLIFLFTGILLLEWLRSRKQHFPWWFELFFITEAVVVIVLTQSRTAYLALLASSLFFFFAQRQRSLDLIKELEKHLRPFVFVLVIAALLFVPLVSRRLLYSLNSFGTGGGFTTRQQLEKEAILLVQKNILWGVGPGMFIPAAFKENPQGIMRYFPEAVHNGYLLFISEHGLLSSICILLFFYFLLKEYEKYPNTMLRTVMHTGLISILVMMLLHPFQNFITLFVLISWLLVYIQQGAKYEPKK